MKMNPKSYDSVIATDVLYDISSLAPLMQTASKLVKVGGYFILSHVPRASVEADNGDGGSAAVARADVLESLIVEEGTKHGLCLESFLRRRIVIDLGRTVFEHDLFCRCRGRWRCSVGLPETSSL
jgi:2-polyprenyl-3-methyl-5-hydroxy-6-metoxy-1,4-benzoquinol methylase